MNMIIVFVDGLGIGSADPDLNPCVQEGLNHFGCYRDGDKFIKSDPESELIAVDATLSVPGLPQSATGQVTLLTGHNASKILGRHLYGFPNQPLRDILKSHSVLKRIKDEGLTCDFLNTFRPPFFNLPESTKWRLSATTGATLAAGLEFHPPEHIAESKSIYHDITGGLLWEKGFDVPILTLGEAGRIVARQSKFYDLLLFEYFLTDQIGHKQDSEKARQEILKLDSFISYILIELDLENTLLIVTSDHGNIEELSTKSHTQNPAMTLTWGKKKTEFAANVKALTDITPVLLKLLDINDQAP